MASKTESATEDDNTAGADFSLLQELLGYQLRRAQALVFQNFADHLSAKDITPGQIGLLILIRNNSGISQSALAKAAGVERATLGELITRFEDRGLVSRRPSKSDRRAFAVSLSRKGQTFLNECIPIILEHEKEIAQGLSEKELGTLLALLQKLVASLVR